MTELEKKIYEIVRCIPEGKVMTYGQIAEIAGDVHLARFVGNVMHKNPLPFFELARTVGFSDEGKFCRPCIIDGEEFLPVPCHRVVNASGKMGANFGMGGPAIQEKMLVAEGVEVSAGRVCKNHFCTQVTSENTRI